MKRKWIFNAILVFLPGLMTGQNLSVQDYFGLNVPLTVYYDGAPGADGSWIGLYKSDAVDGAYIYYQYINTSTEGSVTFEAEFAPGYYNFRMFEGSGYNKVATSKAFLVRQGMVVDTDFGNNGFVTWNPSSQNRYNSAKAARMLSDGSLIVAGEMKTGTTSSDGYEEVSITLMKLTPDGLPDNDFGDDGLVNQVVKSSFTQIYLGEVTALAIQDDGKVIVGGNVVVYFASDNLAQLALLARFNPDGALDETFGDKGIEYYAFKYPGDGPVDSYLRFVEPAGDGRILAGGGSILHTAFAPGWPAAIRVLPNGMSDNSFGGTGVVLFTDSIYWRGFMEGIVLNQDNSFYAVTSAVAQFGENHQLLYRIKNDGSLDAGFGDQGLKAIHDPLAANDWSSNTLMRHPSGGLWVIGQNGWWGIWSARCSETTGEIISSYGENGFMHATPYPQGGISVAGAALHGQAAHVAYTSLGRRMGMSRIGPNGQIDLAFGHSFLELQDAGQSFVELSVTDVVQLNEDRFVLVGNGRYPSGPHWETMVAAFKNNPEIIVSVAEPEAYSPGARLGHVFPNPCGGDCAVSLELAENSYAFLELYNLSGIKAGELFRGFLPSGRHELEVNGGMEIPEGMYILRLSVSHGSGMEVLHRKFVKL